MVRIFDRLAAPNRTIAAGRSIAYRFACFRNTFPNMDVEHFISRWSGRAGGQERANYALFLTELCDVLGVARPDPAGDPEANDYVFERVVTETARDGSTSAKRIDLYKRGCFVLEAKQSRQKGGLKEIAGQSDLLDSSEASRGKRGADRAWDVLMLNARRQAEDYVRLLPSSHTSPPFIIVCDVGHCLEFYANFRGDGRAYDQFPDRQGFRVYLDDLRKADIRERSKLILDAALIVSGFKQGKSIEPKMAAVRAALTHIGVISTGDGGKTFAVRRVA